MKTIAQQLNIKDFPFSIKDKNGNRIYWEDYNRFWIKGEFDSNGNKIYWENSVKDWGRYEYDSNGNPTYCKYSTEWWYKSEYDSNGNRIYYENSDGLIKDNRPKGCDGRVIEIDGKKYKLVSE